MTQENLYVITTSHGYPYAYSGSFHGFSVGRNVEEALRNYAKEQFPKTNRGEKLLKDLKKQFKFIRVEVPTHKINLEKLTASSE